MFDTLLVPTDGGGVATRAARLADAIADSFDETVHVIRVVSPWERERGEWAIERNPLCHEHVIP